MYITYGKQVDDQLKRSLVAQVRRRKAVLSVSFFTWLRRAQRKRIAHKVLQTPAIRLMIGHRARGVHAAGTATRIDAALVDARLIAATVRILRTLRPAVGRPANVVADARADRRVADDATLRVGSAGRRIAGINGDGRTDGCN